MAKTPAKLTSRAPLAAVVVVAGEVSELVVMLVAMLGVLVIVELRIVLRTGAVCTGREGVVTVVADFVLSLGFPTFSMVDWAAASCSSKNINCASHRVHKCVVACAVTTSKLWSLTE
jgi:hypothetical protein